MTGGEVSHTDGRLSAEQDPASQRQDGLLIDWATNNFYFLEFTRVNDEELDHLAQTSAKKKAKYQALKRHYLQHLQGWKGEVLPFTIGMRGTLIEAQWKQTLGQLGLTSTNHEALAITAVEATLQGLDTMFQARLARLHQPPPPSPTEATAHPPTAQPNGPLRETDSSPAQHLLPHRPPPAPDPATLRRSSRTRSTALPRRPPPS